MKTATDTSGETAIATEAILAKLEAMSGVQRMQTMLDVAHSLTLHARMVIALSKNGPKKLDMLYRINEAIHRLVNFRPDSELFFYEAIFEIPGIAKIVADNLELTVKSMPIRVDGRGSICCPRHTRETLNA